VALLDDALDFDDARALEREAEGLVGLDDRVGVRLAN
jgi:hypothetical protein